MNTLRFQSVSVLLGAMAVTIFFVFLAPQSAHAAVTKGDLVKCAKFSSVYYLADDGKRYNFPNEKVFKSWYNNFDNVKEITCDDLATLPLGGNVPYQAGTRLIKIPSVPKVYAVSSNGRIRPIKDEAQARELYGDDWASLVDDMPETFFPQYKVEQELDDQELPEGYVLEDEGGVKYSVDDNGEAIEIDTESDLEATKIREKFARKLAKLKEKRAIKVQKIRTKMLDKMDERRKKLRKKLRAVEIDDEDVDEMFKDLMELQEQKMEDLDEIEKERRDVLRKRDKERENRENEHGTVDTEDSADQIVDDADNGSTNDVADTSNSSTSDVVDTNTSDTVDVTADNNTQENDVPGENMTDMTGVGSGM